MSDPVNPGDLIDYFKKNMIDLLLSQGETLAGIMAKIKAMSNEHSLKAHFVLQILAFFPVRQHAIAKRLLMGENQDQMVTVIVVSFPGAPKMEVPIALDVEEVAAQIEKQFGRQKNDHQHQWRYESVPNDR